MEWDREDWKFMAVAARCLCLAPRLITSSAAVALVTDTCSNITVSAWKLRSCMAHSPTLCKAASALAACHRLINGACMCCAGATAPLAA